MTKFPPSIFQRVERASSEAAREVFGNNYQSVLEQVHVDDDALVEGKVTLIINVALLHFTASLDMVPSYSVNDNQFTLVTRRPYWI